MSNKLNDLATGFLVTCPISPTVALLTGTVTGPAIDFLNQDGNCFAVQICATVIGTSPTLVGKIQESPTTTAASFTDVSGAVFPTVTTVGTSAPQVQVITFQRTQRFLRYVGVVGGNTVTVAADAVLLGQLKQFGG